MKVRVITDGAPPHEVRAGSAVPGASADREDLGSAQDATPPVTYGGWAPRLVLGAPSPGGLILPAAEPTAAWLYAPRGVWIDDERVIVCDTGNHRVLVWQGIPDEDGAPADVVLGQPDEHSEGPAAGGTSTRLGMNLPTGVIIDDGRLVVADAWHHRILVWHTIPTQTATPPDLVIGQPDLDSVDPNAGGEPTGTSLYWPFGIAIVDGRCYVADTGNRRVLVWRDGLPLDGRPADVVLGQADSSTRDENSGEGVGPHSFRWPHAIAGDGQGGVLVADAGNHRVLRWARHPDTDLPADGVLGQPDFESGSEFPYTSQAGRLRFPYAIATHGSSLAVADTANNRVLVHDRTDASGHDIPAVVLAQPDVAANGENRWTAVAADTLCWPYGLSWHEGERALLVVADSGNNRAVIWERT